MRGRDKLHRLGVKACNRVPFGLFSKNLFKFDNCQGDKDGFLDDSALVTGVVSQPTRRLRKCQRDSGEVFIKEDQNKQQMQK